MLTTIYHVTGGEYECYGTVCFVKGPLGLAEAINDSFKKYSKALLEDHGKVRALQAKFGDEFEREFGKPPPPALNGNSFSKAFPELSRILSIGKKHENFSEAKRKNTEFLEAKTLRGIEANYYNEKKSNFIEKKMAGVIPPTKKNISLEDFLPANCSIVKISEVNVNDSFGGNRLYYLDNDTDPSDSEVFTFDDELFRKLKL